MPETDSLAPPVFLFIVGVRVKLSLRSELRRNLFAAKPSVGRDVLVPPYRYGHRASPAGTPALRTLSENPIFLSRRATKPFIFTRDGAIIIKKPYTEAK